MDEKALQARVFALLRARPALVWHACASTRTCAGHAGAPDLCVIGNRVIFRELKGDTTRARLHQLSYGDAIARAGVSWGIWRPADLDSGRIERELDELLSEGAAART